ncbi:MAG TPA: PQQ-binding-like beta-propeller repeat protein [Gemmataceae bacterium]|nr:PQQ-binding-like beta-propeller repeat protein [Gemmataceae bacterium]
MACLRLSLCVLAGLLVLDSSTAWAQANAVPAGAEDWPCWRGPTFNGVAGDRAVVLEWSETKNVIWKTPVPGRGHSSPIVVGSRVFLSTADEQRNLQSVLCYDRGTGKELWRKDVHAGGAADGRLHKKNTRASSTLACDGKRVYAVFHHDGDIWATALDLTGNQVWQKKVGTFVSHWGYSASPTIYHGSLIVATDHKGGGGLHALDLRTGELRWETARPKAPTYASPVVLKVAGKDQLVIAGGDQVIGYDPANGKQLWSVKGTSVECVSTVLAEGDRVFATGGFPAKETLCIRADGSAEVVWRVKVGDFVPSQLLHRGHLYSVLDNGVVLCLNADTGEQLWKERLSSTAFSASPILVGEHLFIPGETGKTHVFRANPNKLELVAENLLGKQAFASPVACGGHLYLRVVEGNRQEMLYCIGRQLAE